MPIRKKGDVEIQASASGAKVKQTGYTFYSYDKKSAALYFQFREQDGQPTDLGKATIHLVMILNDDGGKEFIPKSDEIEVISAIRGTAKYVLPEMLLSYSGKVTGYVYMDFDDGSQSDDGQFTFRIKQSMITHVLPEAGDKYVQDFEDVKERVEQAGDSATKDIEKAKDDAESQIGDYVGEVESAKSDMQESVDQVNKDYEVWKAEQEEQQTTFESDTNKTINGINTKVEKAQTKVSDLKKNLDVEQKNYFSVEAWKERASTAVITNDFPATKIRLEANTKYTLSTNIPKSGDNKDVFFAAGDVYEVKNPSEGVAIDEPRTITTNFDGAAIVAIRDKDMTSGDWWIMLNKGETSARWVPNADDLATKQYVDESVEGFNETITTQLAQKATYQTVFGMSNLNQEVKNAMTGGSVAVVGKNAVSQANITGSAVTPTETNFIIRNVLSDTLVDDSKIQTGMYYQFNTGNIVESSRYNTTGLIPCVPGATYTRSFPTGQISFWDKNGDYVSGMDMINTIIDVPDDARIAYMRVTYATYESYEHEGYKPDPTKFRVNKGDKLLPKDTYKEGYAFEKNIQSPNLLTIQEDLNRLNTQNSFTLRKTMSYQHDYSYSEYRGEDTTFWTTHIHQNKFDGDVNYPKVRLTAENVDDPNTQSVKQYVASNNHDLVINGGIFNMDTDIADGYLIIDGEIVKDKLSTTHTGQHTLAVMEDGTLTSFEESVNPTELLEQGVQQAVVGFIPIIIDGEIPSDDFLNICPHAEIKNPRQVIGQYPNGDYMIFTCDGRKEGEAGMTLREAGEIMQELGVSFAYNLDGGGSTQTFMSKKRINAFIEDRPVPNVLVF